MFSSGSKAVGGEPAPALSFPGGNVMTESRFSVVHVRMTSDRPFADVQAALERQLGRFEPDVYQALA
jgi:hypothetical protein